MVEPGQHLTSDVSEIEALLNTVLSHEKELREKLEETQACMCDKIATAKTLRQNVRNYLSDSDVPQSDIVKMKNVHSEAKSFKPGIIQLIKHANDNLLQQEITNDNQQQQNNLQLSLINFDLARFKRQWLELRQLLKDLNRESSRRNHSENIYLYYSTGETSGYNRDVSPIDDTDFPPKRFCIPSSSKKIGLIRRSDPKNSLLKEKGRSWVTKLSIPYRVFIKSKVKLRYKGRSSLDTSFTGSDLSTITENSVFNSSIGSAASASTARSCYSEPATCDLDILKRELDDTYDDNVLSSRIFNLCDEDEHPVVHNKSDNHDADLDELINSDFQPIDNELIDDDDYNKFSQPDNATVTKEEDNKNKQQNSVIMASVDIKNAELSSSPKSSRQRASPVSIDDQSSIVTKRRRLNSDDSVSNSTSPRESPMESPRNSPRDSPIPMMDHDSSSPIKMMMAAQRSSSSGSTKPLSLLSPISRGDSPDLKYPMPERVRGAARQGSPLSKYLSLSPGTISPLTTPGGASTEDLTSLIFDGALTDVSMNSSTLSTPLDSPHLSRATRDFRKKYRKDELWAAIQSDYQYLMDEEIIETCKSTESDLSLESDEGGHSTNACSFTEFLQQYNEMTDWLNQTQAALLRKSDSRSEKYLNQSYQEELQSRAPRKKLFQDYGKKLIRRYPAMKEEIQARLLRVNTQWQELESVIAPQTQYHDEEAMLRDLEEDMSCLRTWLYTVEGELTMQNPSPDWTQLIIQDKINSHKVLQKDIESHSKIISSVLKVCERLQTDNEDESASDKESVKAVAVSLERRWHNIWLQSLEWQCRLEEALAGKGFRSRRSLDDLEDCDDLSGYTITTPIGTQTEACGSSSFGTDPIHISPDNRYPLKNRISGGAGKSSGESDFEYYSDTSGNYDVIPFSENEYEKIPVDTDTADDDNEHSATSNNEHGSRISPDYNHKQEILSTGSGCDDTDQGIDSALGRSYSDQSIGRHSNEESSRSCPTVYTHSDIKLLSGAGSGGANSRHASTTTKVIIAAKNNVVEMSVGSRHDMNKKGAGSSRDASDVGYSSESHHSNEELDNKAKDSDNSPSEEQQQHPNATSTPHLGNTNKSWRHSITSAYDTCSTGSDPNLHQPEDDDYLDLSESKEHKPYSETSFHSLTSTDNAELGRSSSNFYCMTTIEGGDIDPSLSSCSYDPASTTSYTGGTTDLCESGNTSDSELCRSIEIPYDEDPAFSTLSNIEEEEMVNESDSLPPADYNDDRLSQEDLSHLTKAASTLLRYVEKRKPFKKSDSMSVQVDSSEDSCRDQDISEDELNYDDNGNGGNRPSDAVRKLIQQAESLVGDTDLNKLQNHKWPQFKEHADEVVKKCKKNRHSDSLNTSTDGQQQRSDCDASSEGDYLSESQYNTDENEHMTVLSSDGYSGTDAEHQRSFRSTMESVSSATTMAAIPKSSSDYQVRNNDDDEFGPVKLRSKKRNGGGRRPHSVTELYERTSGLDLRPFSISEGALYKLQRQRPSSENLSHFKLRKTFSDHDKSLAVKRLDSPKKSGKRKSPSKKGLLARSRSNSEEIQDGGAVKVEGIVTTEEPADSKSSAVEFEENAWDHYQAQPYSNVSSDCGEEKLDASELQGDWDHSAEFEDDFGTDYGVGAILAADKKSSNKSVIKPVFEDSDSDLEDFQNVITESQKALSFTGNTLRKPHKDPMETGIYLDPSEYNESVATCRTQMKCLGDVVDTLQTEVGLTNVTQDNIQQVLDIISEWRVLECEALERLYQSQQLAGLYKDVVSTQGMMEDIMSKLSARDFHSATDVEKAIKLTQENKSQIEKLRGKLSNLRKGIAEFENNQSGINMSRFRSEASDLQAYMDQLDQTCDSRSCALQSCLIALYDFSEHQRELQQSLDREQQQLKCRELAHNLVTFTRQEVKDTLQDLKKLECEFPKYNGKLQLLRVLQQDISNSCHVNTETQTQAQIGLLDNQLTELKHRHETISINMQQRLLKLDEEDVQMVSSVGFSGKSGSAHAVGTSTATASTSTDPAPRGKQRSLLMRVLRATLPINLVLLAVLILAYLFNPDMFDNFSVVFSPQLRYVRGPPPT